MLEQIQRAYNEMHAHFSKPGAVLGQTVEDCGEKACVYLGPADERCAIGCRLPAEWVERVGAEHVNASGSVFGLTRNFPEVQEFIGHVTEWDEHNNWPVAFDPLLEFHSDAQTAHDQADTVEHFLMGLDLLAEKYGLTLVSKQREETRIQDHGYVSVV